MKYILYYDVCEYSQEHKRCFTFESATLCDGVKDCFGALHLIATCEDDHIHLEYCFNKPDKKGEPEKHSGSLNIPFGESRYTFVDSFNFFTKKWEYYYYSFQARPINNKQAHSAFMGHHIGPDDRMRFYIESGNRSAVKAELKRKYLSGRAPIKPLGSGVDPDILKEYVESEIMKGINEEELDKYLEAEVDKIMK